MILIPKPVNYYNTKYYFSTRTVRDCQTPTIKGPCIMAYGEKGISVLAKSKTLIIMIMFIGQNPYSDMNNSLMKVVRI